MLQIKNRREFFSKNILTKVTTPIKKYDIVGFDIETHGYKNKLLVAGLFDDKYRRFLEKEEFIQYVEEKATKNTRYIATNLGFDFQGIFYNTQYWNKYKLILKGGKTISAKHEKVQMLDTMNYTSAGVKKLGEQIGIPKIRYKEMLGKVPKTKRQWYYLYEYNQRDCKVSKIWTEEFQKALDILGCELKITIASCAMDLYRRKYLEKSIYKESIKVKDIIYKSYYGGRCEVFKRGKLKCKSMNRENNNPKYYYWRDYNSAYAYQMLKDYPLPSSAKRTKQSNIKLIKKYHGVSDVTVNIPYSKYPLLPYRKEDGKLIFPYGKWRGCYNHIELQRAIELYGEQCIIRVHETLFYTKTFKPFYKYVKDLYALRMKYKSENNIIMTEVCKSLLTNLYGKFAMKDIVDITFYDFHNMTNEEIRERDDDGEFDDMEVTEIQKNRIMKGYKELKKECEQNYILPILSNCVTSYQRVTLHKDLVELNGLYCDTDCILTEREAKDNYELGGLKIEKLVSKGWLIKPKFYMIYDKTIKDGKEKGWDAKVKGLNKLDNDKFIEVLNNKSVAQKKFMKIKEAMKRGYLPNQILKFKKKQDIEDDKRVWSERFDKDKLQDSEPIYITE
jgi:hypothetical protein